MMKKMGMIWFVWAIMLWGVNCPAAEVGMGKLDIMAQNTPVQTISKNDAVTDFPKESKAGLYVDSLAGFAVPYPETWSPAEKKGRERFRAEPKTRYPSFRVWFFPNLQLPLEGLSKMWTSILKNYSKGDIKVVYDHETRTAAGVEAREVELEWTTNEKTPRPNMKLNTYYFGIKKPNGWIVVGVYSVDGKVKEDVKKKIHAITLKPETDVS